MTAPTPLSPAQVESYLQAAREGDGHGAGRLAMELLERGVPFEAIVTGCLGAAQTRVGENWLDTSWSVADEHQVTAVTQRSLNALAGSVEVAGADGHVVVACAEGDWHALPAQMFSELLRHRGFEVSFLGASTPAAHLRRFLSRRGADALVVSCATVLYYPGVTRLARVAHECDVPVLAGGGAFGDVPERALRLGADAGATGIEAAEATLRSWIDRGPDRRAHGLGTGDETASVPWDAAHVTDEAYAELGRQSPLLAGTARAVGESPLESVRYIAESLSAARQSHDPTVFLDFVRWLRMFHTHRQVPDELLRAALTAVAAVVARTDPAAAQLAEKGVELLPDRPTPAA